MTEVLNRLGSQNYFTGAVDLFTTPDLGQLAFEITGQVLKNKKLDQALSRLKNNLGEILSNINFRQEIEDAEFILGFGKPQKNPWEQLRSSVRFIESFAIKHKKKFCFALDEFGDVEKLDGIEIIKLFRGVIQSQKQSVYIFCGSYESVMNRLFVTSKSPFYRMVRIIEPGFLSHEPLAEFMEAKFREMKIKFEMDHINEGIDFTKGHPYYARLFVQEYYFEFLQSKKIPDPEIVFQNMMASENNYLEKLWDDISSRKETRLVILKIVETGKPYTAIEDNSINITRALKELAGRGLVFHNKEGYTIADPLLCRFIRDRILKS